MTIDAHADSEKLVAHYVDGRVARGFSSDFSPDRLTFIRKARGMR